MRFLHCANSGCPAKEGLAKGDRACPTCRLIQAKPESLRKALARLIVRLLAICGSDQGCRADMSLHGIPVNNSYMLVALLALQRTNTAECVILW